MTKKRGFWILCLGLIIFGVSIYPMFLITKEKYIYQQLENRYHIKAIVDIRTAGIKHSNILDDSLELIGNNIQIVSEDTGLVAPMSRVNPHIEHIYKITAIINGVSFPSTEAWLDPKRKDDSRFLSWLQVFEIQDRKIKENKIAIIQRLSGNWVKGQKLNIHTESQNWRILFIDMNKNVTVETFTYPERAKHLLGVKLVQLSSQSSSFIGYQSDILTFLPSLFFPSIYPQLTFYIGIVLIIIGLVRLSKSKKILKE
jgi:hypothetical protein